MSAGSLLADGWPPNCPPGDAVDASGVYYRVAKSPLADDDFKTHHETGKRKTMDPCERRCLSICGTVDDAVQTRRLYPMLGTSIAEGTLGAASGKTRFTNGVIATHSNWWPTEPVAARRTRFAIIQG
jgi:hypothetical protein